MEAMEVTGAQGTLSPLELSAAEMCLMEYGHTSDCQSDDSYESPTMHQMDAALNRYTKSIKKYLEELPDLPSWDPPVYWNYLPKGLPARNEEELGRVRSLALPYMQGSPFLPDMLLYGLGDLQRLDEDFPARLIDFVAGDEHIFLCNASGTGKTRMLFETLAHSWGLYFSCSFHGVSNPYGSCDLDEALNNVQSTSMRGSLIQPDVPLSELGSFEMQADLQRNRDIAARVFRRVFVARLLVLDRFIDLVQELAVDDASARMKWLQLQLRPKEILRFDLFAHLIDFMHDKSDEYLSSQIKSLYEVHKSRIVFVAVDEAQVALNMYKTAFVSRATAEHVPVFEELFLELGNHFPNARLVAAGTELGLDLMTRVVRMSGSMHKNVRFFHNLGGFLTERRVRSYMDHFLGRRMASRHASTAFRWLRGRHRLLANLIMFTLTAGNTQLMMVLETFIFKFTGYHPSESPIIEYLPIRIAIEDEQFEKFLHPELLRDAVYAFIDHNRMFSTADTVHQLVYLGVALYQGNPVEAGIFEPLVLLSLCRWLMSSPRFSTHALIRRRLDDEALDVSTPEFLHGLAACLAPIISRPQEALSDYLQFCGPEPPWADRTAQLVIPRSNRKNGLQFKSSWAGPLVHVARDADDTLRWLERADCPFLLPDLAFGADMVFFLQLVDIVTLVCIHLPTPRSSRRVKELVPLDPDKFYRKVPRVGKALRTILRTLPALPATSHSVKRSRLARYSILHVLCFAEARDLDECHNPPIATLRVNRVFEDPSPPPIQFLNIVSAL